MVQFSLLMSVYKNDDIQYFRDCMESVWTHQYHKPDEIVLVQDGPIGDEVLREIDCWKQQLQERLSIIVLPINQGTGIAKNEGLKHCRYDWVAIMDVDDISLPDRFLKQISFLEKNPDCDMLGGQVEEACENEQIRLKKTPIKDRDIREFALKRNPFTHVTLFFRRSLALSVGGYLDHYFMEDYNICLRMLKQARMVHNLPVVLCRVHINKKTIQRRRGWRYIKSEWALFQLKRELHIQNSLFGFLYFIIRSIPRVLPANILEIVYRIMLRADGKSKE